MEGVSSLLVAIMHKTSKKKTKRNPPQAVIIFLHMGRSLNLIMNTSEAF